MRLATWAEMTGQSKMHGSYWLPYKAVLDELGSTVKRFGVRRTQGCPAQSSRYISFVEILLQKGNVNIQLATILALYM